MTTTGTLTAETDEAVTLEQDVFNLLMRFHRQQGLRILRLDVTDDDIKSDAKRMASELALAIGGRYVPKRISTDQQRRDRNIAVKAAFNGKNRDEVMRKFKISKALFYNITR